MNFQDRKRLILAFLDEEPSLNVRELSDRLKVSEITVRRDLNVMANKGLVTRTHGGAMNNKYAEDRTRYINKAVSNPEKKRYIAKIAADLIHDGDSIFMDCGSTVFCLCPFLKMKAITVITNSIPVLSELVNTSVKINFIGGEVDRERLAIHGHIAGEHIKRYHADKAFIGADGVSRDGLSANTEEEASISLAMALRAREVMLLCDSTKLNQPRYLNFAPLSIIHKLITDDMAPDHIIEELRNDGLQVVNQ